MMVEKTQGAESSKVSGPRAVKYLDSNFCNVHGHRNLSRLSEAMGAAQLGC